MNGIPRELDWVKERAACTLAKVFRELHYGVAEDVKTANSLSLPNGNSFQVVIADEKAFTVRHGEAIKPVVTFMLEDKRIVISSDVSNEELRFTVGLNDEGRCQLRQNGHEFEQWQVRRMALEGLFFA